MVSHYAPLKCLLFWQSLQSTSQEPGRVKLIQIIISIDLDLSTRLEYFTLAVGNAKSHPVTANGRHETAIAFLTDLEEKLDVAQVQLEVYNALLPHAGNPGDQGLRIRQLNKKLFTISEVYYSNIPVYSCLTATHQALPILCRAL